MRRAEALVEDRSATDLLREIREKAEAERDAIIEAARRRAEEIALRSRRECDRIEREGLADAERGVAVERDRVLGTIRAEARAQLLAFKRTAIDGVFAAAEEAIERRIGGPAWQAALAALLDEAVGFVGPGAAIEVAEGDLAFARAWAGSNPAGHRITGTAGARGNVTATSADSRRRAENGLAARQRRVKESGTADVARALFVSR